MSRVWCQLALARMTRVVEQKQTQLRAVASTLNTCLSQHIFVVEELIRDVCKVVEALNVVTRERDELRQSLAISKLEQVQHINFDDFFFKKLYRQLLKWISSFSFFFFFLHFLPFFPLLKYWLKSTRYIFLSCRYLCLANIAQFCFIKKKKKMLNDQTKYSDSTVIKQHKKLLRVVNELTQVLSQERAGHKESLLQIKREGEAVQRILTEHAARLQIEVNQVRESKIVLEQERTELKDAVLLLSEEKERSYAENRELRRELHDLKRLQTEFKVTWVPDAVSNACQICETPFSASKRRVSIALDQ